MNDLNDLKVCNACGEGHLHPSTWEGDFRHYDGTIHVAGLQCHRCDVCDADPVFPDQIAFNEKRIADAKRKETGRLVGREVRVLREQLGLTQQQAATLFGGGANAFSKYERGEVMQSVAMDRLMKAAAFVPGVLEFLQVEAEFRASGTVGGVEAYCVKSSIELPKVGERTHLRVVREAHWGAVEAA